MRSPSPRGRPWLACLVLGALPAGAELSRRAEARRARDEFYKQEWMRPDVVFGLDMTLKQAIELKRVPPDTTIDQVRAVVAFPRPAP